MWRPIDSLCLNQRWCKETSSTHRDETIGPIAPRPRETGVVGNVAILVVEHCLDAACGLESQAQGDGRGTVWKGKGGRPAPGRERVDTDPEPPTDRPTRIQRACSITRTEAPRGMSSALYTQSRQRRDATFKRHNECEFRLRRPRTVKKSKTLSSNVEAL